MPKCLNERYWSKRPHYAYNADAIREQPSGRTDPITSFGTVPKRWDGGRSYAIDGLKGANARDVWTISADPFRTGEHTATMPQALAERCILAGSRPGDVVLDPFAGVSTTGMVADRLGRSSVGIELHPGHAATGRNRVRDDCPMFAKLAAA